MDDKEKERISHEVDKKLSKMCKYCNCNWVVPIKIINSKGVHAKTSYDYCSIKHMDSAYKEKGKHVVPNKLHTGIIGALDNLIGNEGHVGFTTAGTMRYMLSKEKIIKVYEVRIEKL